MEEQEFTPVPEQEGQEVPPQPDDPQPEEGFAPKVEGENVNFSGFALGAAAGRDMTMSDSAAFGVAVGRDLTLSDGGSFAMTIGGNVTITDGGAFSMLAGGSTDIQEGGAAVIITGQASARNSRIGVLLARSADLAEGTQVTMDTKRALAFGAAFGAVFALLSWLLRRR